MDKVEKILVAARDLLIAEGPEAFNTNRIAREAGVAIGSVYEYFDSKQAIVDRLIDYESATETREILEAYMKVIGRPQLEVINAIVSIVYQQYQRNGSLYRMLWAMAPEARKVGHRPGERAVIRAIEQRFATIGVEQPELAAFVVFHLVESLSERFASHAGEQFRDEQLIGEIVQVVARYIRVS